MSRLPTRRIPSTTPNHSLTLHSPSQTKRSPPSLRTRHHEPNKSPLPPSNLSGSSHSTRWNYPYTARDGRKRSTTLDPRRYLRRNSSSPTRPLPSLRLQRIIINRSPSPRIHERLSALSRRIPTSLETQRSFRLIRNFSRTRSRTLNTPSCRILCKRM